VGEDVIVNIPSAEIKIETFAPTVLVSGVGDVKRDTPTILLQAELFN
jgi:hypothetical protein